MNIILLPMTKWGGKPNSRCIFTDKVTALNIVIFVYSA